MPLTLSIIRQRKDRRLRTLRSVRKNAGRVFFVVGYVLSGLLALALLAGALAYASLTSDLPSAKAMPVLLDPNNGILLEPTRFYDRSGLHLLGTIAPTDANRTYITYDQFPQALIDATTALADPDFWNHGGYTWDGWQDAGSHPTLAQRLVADLLLWNEKPNSRRGLRERLLAAQLTAEYGRDQIMEWYLNSADYGGSAYGAEAAAQLYFGKPVSEINLSESALLAALSQSPALNPLDAPEAAEEIRKLALQEMQSKGMISPEEGADAAARPPAILLDLAGKPVSDEAAFVDLALHQLGQRFDPQRIRRGGLVVTTTMDFNLQQQAACGIRNEFSILAGQPPEIPAAEGGPCEAAKALSLTSQPGVDLAEASASALILDPRTGQVLAVVGDTSGQEAGPYLQPHAAGTLLTPFLYLDGFTRGLGPASLVWDIPGGLINFDGQYRGPVRLRIALVNDYLPPAQGITEKMGAESIRHIMTLFGLDIPSGLDLLKDDVPVFPQDAAAAYGVFANRGTLAGQVLENNSISPAAVLKVTGVDGAVWADWTSPQMQAVASPQLAYIMTDVLGDGPARQTGNDSTDALELDRPSAAKTSRSFDLSSAWTTGYTPQRVVVVHFQGGRGASQVSADLWHALISAAVIDLPPETWDVPAGVTTVSVCDPSGLLPTDACPRVVSEKFLAGNEPIQSDNLYQSFQVDRETGLLATVFTPPELVEEKIYLIAPPEAQAWAEGMNLPVPPTEYDAIQSQTTLPYAYISSPRLFAQVSGTIELRGTAAGEDFSFYRLEYGQGLNPRSWVQIGTDSTTPVTAGLLGTWDTSGLNGLYALRLMVVRADRRVEQALRVVTVSNP